MVGTHARDTCVWHSTTVKCAQDENRCIFPSGKQAARGLQWRRGVGRRWARDGIASTHGAALGFFWQPSAEHGYDPQRLLETPLSAVFSFFGLCFLGSRFVQVHFMDVGAMSLAMGLKVCCSACLLAMELKLS